MHYTRFERARILGARALQISLGAPGVLEAVTADARALQISLGAPGVLEAVTADIDPMRIAVREFEAGSVPLTVPRFPHGRD